MLRRRLPVLGFALALATAGWLGHRMRNAEEADNRLARAERLLRASIEEVPSLQEVRATEVRGLCEEAEELHASAKAAGMIEEARAIERYQRGELVQADQALSRAKKLAGDAPLTGLLSATLAAARHDQPRAHAELSALLTTAQDDPRALLLAADLARDQGLGDEALGYTMRALAAHPNAAIVHERLGLAHELLGDQVDARADYERAAHLDRRATTPLLHLGRLLRDAGQMEGALLAFRGAAERSPSAAEAFIGSGVCRAARGDRVGARADFEQAQSLASNRPEPLIGLGDLDLAEGDVQSALRRYRAATLLDQKSTTGLVKLGNALVRTHAAAAAVDAFRKAIDLAPDLAQAHNGMGAALLGLGETSAAEKALAVAAELDLHDPNPLLNLALLRQQSGDSAGAEAALAQAKARDPKLLLASLTQHSGRPAPRARGH